MRRFLFSLFTIIIIFLFNNSSARAEHPQLSDDCMNEFREKYVEFTNNIFADIFATFEDLAKQQTNRDIKYFTFDNIRDTTLLLGKEEKLLNSLSKFFGGVSKGDRRLYFFNGDPNKGYLLYKESSNQNVMVQLKRTKNEWVEVKRDVKKGRDIELKKPKCLDEYLLRRWFYESFGEYKIF